MKERKHKYGKRNRLRIAAGLAPLTQTGPPKPLQPEEAQATALSVLAIQAATIAELQTDITELQRRLENLKYAFRETRTLLGGAALIPSPLGRAARKGIL